MKDCDFMLELSDGTVVRVESMSNSRQPDVKAFYFPAGVLTPFSYKNLPTQRRGEGGSDSAFSTSL